MLNQPTISKEAADFLLSKIQEIVDEKNTQVNGADKWSSDDQCFMLAAIQKLENYLKSNGFTTTVNPIDSKMSFKPPMLGEMLTDDKMEKIVDNPDRKVWRINRKFKHFICINLEATFRFSDRTWQFNAWAYNPNRPGRPLNLNKTRVGGERLPISEVTCQDSTRLMNEIAHKIGYILFYGNI